MEQVLACTKQTAKAMKQMLDFCGRQWQRSKSSCLLLLCMLMLLLSFLMQPAFDWMELDATEQVIFIQFVVFVLPAALYFWQERGKVTLRLKPIALVEMPVIALASVALSITCLLLSSILLAMVGSGQSSVGNGVPGAGTLRLGLFAGAVLPAVCEELLMRGAVLREQESMGKICVLLSGLTFAMLHGSLENLVGPCIAGCVYAVLTIRYQSILPAMVCHFINNAYIFLIGRVLEQSGGMDMVLLIYIINVVLLFSCVYGIILYYEKHRDGLQFFRQEKWQKTDPQEIRRVLTSPPFVLFCALWVCKLLMAL